MGSGGAFGLYLSIAAGFFGLVIGLFFLLRYLTRDKLLGDVEKAIQAEEFHKAAGMAKKLLKQGKAGFLAYRLLGQAYQGAGDFDSAIHSYEQGAVMAKEEGHNALENEMNVKIGQLYRKIGEERRALGYFKMVIANGFHKTALYEAAEILMSMNSFTQAKPYLDQILKVQPNHYKSRYLLGRIYWFMKEYAACASELEQVLHDIQPENNLFAKVSFMLAECDLELKRFDAGVNALSPLFDDSEFGKKSIVKSIEILTKGGKLSDASGLLQSFDKRLGFEQKAEANYLIAESHFAKEDYYTALDFWQRCFQANPRYKDVEEIMDRFRFLIENPKLEKFFSSSPDLFQQSFETFFKIRDYTVLASEKSYWVVKNKAAAFVIYRLPQALPAFVLSEIAQVLKVNSVGFGVTFYSLYGIGKGGEKTFHQLGSVLVEGTDFVKEMNQNLQNDPWAGK